MEQVSVRTSSISLRSILLFYLTFYLTYYNISIMYDFMPLRPYLEPFFLPKFFRVIEMAFVFGLFYFFILNNIKNAFFGLFYFFITFQVIRCFSLGIELFPYRLLSVFHNFGFFIVFLMLLNVSFISEDLNYVFNYYKKYLYLNIFLSLFIVFPLTGYKIGDFFNALYIDSHLFGVYLYIASTYLFVLFYLKNRKKYLFWSVFFLLLQLFPLNEKVILFNLIVYGVIIIYFSNNKIFLIWKIFLFMLLSGSIFLFLNYQGWLRFFWLERFLNPEDLGFILSWPLLFSKLTNFWDFFFGLGPGLYAGQGAQQLFFLGINLPLYDVFEQQFNNIYFNSGFQILWNKATVIIGEYGIVGLFIYVIAYWKLLRIIKNSLFFIGDKGFIFYIIIGVIIFQDLINDTGTIQLLAFPTMLIPAFLYKKI